MSIRPPCHVTRPSVRFAPCLLLLAATLWMPSPLVASSRGQASATRPLYSIRHVGPIGGDFMPFQINDRGQIVGNTTSAEGFFSGKAGTHVVPPPPGTTSIFFYGLSNRGQVVGDVCLTIDCAPGPSPISAQITKTGVLNQGLNVRRDSATTGAGQSVNNRGEIVGFSGDVPNTYDREDNGPPIQTGVVWKTGRGRYRRAALLQPPPGIAYAYANYATGIDGRGDIAGFGRYVGKANTWVGVVWPRGSKPVILPGIRQTPGKPWEPISNVVNDSAFALVSHVKTVAGVKRTVISISGECYMSPGEHLWGSADPCLWTVRKTGKTVHVSRPIKLDKYPGASCGCAIGVAINRHRWIAGMKGDAFNTPALWVPRHGHYQGYDLNRLIPKGSSWSLLGECQGDRVQASVGITGINGRGQIIGAALYRGKPTGFVMTPRHPLSKEGLALSSSTNARTRIKRDAIPCGHR